MWRSKLAMSTLTTSFTNLSSMICVTLARHLTCVPATLYCDGSSWFLSYLRGGCRAEGDGGDSDASEKHKALDRNGFDLFHLPTPYLYSSVHTHVGKYRVFHWFAVYLSLPRQFRIWPFPSGSLTHHLVPLHIYAKKGNTGHHLRA